MSDIKIEFEIPTINFRQRLSKIGIGHIVLISAILRFFAMPFPRNGMIFDEVHYVGAVNMILEGVHANPEHPPLTKFIVAVFVKTFGNHWFAWRFPMVICSLISTYLVYKISRKFVDEQLALLSASFVIFDIIWFIHGNIFMLEPPCMMFGLAFVYLYLDKRYNWSSVAMSLACLASEKAGFLILAVSIYHIVTHLDMIKNIPQRIVEQIRNFPTWLKKDVDSPRTMLDKTPTSIKKITVFFFIFFIVGIGSLQLTDMVMKPAKGAIVSHQVMHIVQADQDGTPITTITTTKVNEDQMYIGNAIEHALWMWQYYSNINLDFKTTPENFRPAWNWITPFSNSIQLFNPSRYLVSVVRFGDKVDFIINYRAQVPLFIWYMTIPIVLMSLFHYKEDMSKLILSWISASYVPWLIRDIFLRNMPFIHYFQFTIPIVVMGIPWFWQKITPKHWKKITAIHLICTILFFFWFFPVGLRRTI